jgi:hypothetical protein
MMPVIFSTDFLAQRESRERREKEEKLRLAKSLSLLAFLFFLAGCDLVAQQYPLTGFNSNAMPGLGNAPSSQSSGIAQSVTQPITQPQVTGAQRTAHVWDKALQGMAMGGAIAGPYGAGGGLIIGLIAGLFTADAYYTQLNGQIQSEQDKDKALEAKIEQELQRQRDLDTKIAADSGNPGQQSQPEQVQLAQKPTVPQATTVAMKQPSTAASSKIEQELQRQRDLDAQLATNSGNPRQQSQLGQSQSAQKPTVPQTTSVPMKGPLTVASNNKEASSTPAPAPFKNVEVKDINGDGIPDLWIYYNPLKAGEIVRQEESTHWDGKVDTWSYFKDGKLVRREVDTKDRGAADTVYYYENDQMVREERDERGLGYASLRVLYQNGHRTKLEEDSSGSGKIDHWVYYDTSADGEVVSKEERDLNGDGVVDLWAYYQNGRLVRRDVSAVGLELVSKQDQLPPSPPDAKEIIRVSAPISGRQL